MVVTAATLSGCLSKRYDPSCHTSTWLHAPSMQKRRNGRRWLVVHAPSEATIVNLRVAVNITQHRSVGSVDEEPWHLGMQRQG